MPSDGRSVTVIGARSGTSSLPSNERDPPRHRLLDAPRRSRSYRKSNPSHRLPRKPPGFTSYPRIARYPIREIRARDAGENIFFKLLEQSRETLSRHFDHFVFDPRPLDVPADFLGLSSREKFNFVFNILSFVLNG